MLLRRIALRFLRILNDFRFEHSFRCRSNFADRARSSDIDSRLELSDLWQTRLNCLPVHGRCRCELLRIDTIFDITNIINIIHVFCVISFFDD